MSATSNQNQNAALSVTFDSEAQYESTQRRLKNAAEAPRPKFYLIKGFKDEYRPLSFRRRQYLKLKTLVDMGAAAAMLFVAAPLMLLTYVAIKIASPGSTLLRQRRITLNGRMFTIYKFRTMRLDAETKSGAVMAGEDDPRIYPLGRFLRKSRLDELPQLINVLNGDMSLVGPRPERPEIAKELEKELYGFYRRTRAKAGLTGLAQVEQGYCSTVDEYRKKLALDLLYVKKQSLLLDISILFRTISVVLFFRGAR